MKNLGFIWILCLVLVSACANDDSVSSSSGGSGGQSTNPPPVGDLIGTWNKICGSSVASLEFARSSIIVGATTATMLTQIFQTSSTCAGTPEMETRSSLGYQAPSYVAGAVNFINMVVNSVQVRINTAVAVQAANLASFCGFNDWQLGVEREVAGRTCVSNLPAAGQPYYDIFKIQGGNLFIGQVDATHDGKRPENRPSELEATPYTR